MYVKVTDGSVDTFPYTIDQLKSENPDVSFPASITDAILTDYGVYPVVKVDAPDHDPQLVKVTMTNPTLVNGKWTQTWEQSNRPTSEAASYMRHDRDKLLAETDYLALSDQTLSAEMATYRQALRDVPSQSGFPFNVTWPTKP